MHFVVKSLKSKAATMSHLIFPGKLWKRIWPSKLLLIVEDLFLRLPNCILVSTDNKAARYYDVWHLECLNNEYEDKGLGAKNEEAHPNPCRRGKQNCNRWECGGSDICADKVYWYAEEGRVGPGSPLPLTTCTTCMPLLLCSSTWTSCKSSYTLTHTYTHTDTHKPTDTKTHTHISIIYRSQQRQHACQFFA